MVLSKEQKQCLSKFCTSQQEYQVPISALSLSPLKTSLDPMLSLLLLSLYCTTVQSGIRRSCLAARERGQRETNNQWK